MTTHPSEPIPCFYLLSATYDLVHLVLLVGDATGHTLMEVSFSSPRAFRTYTESDYWNYLSAFDGRRLIQTVDAGCGIEISGDAPYLLDYRANARHQEVEETFSCLVRTPDHCVEVICFEEPTIRHC